MWIFDDASVREILWTLYNGFGSVLVAGLCLDVWKDSRNRVLMADDARRKATWLCLGITFIFVGAMLTYAAIGLAAMTTETHGGVSPAGRIAFVGFMLVGTSKIVLCSYWRYLRFKLRARGVNPHIAMGKASTQ